MKTKLLCIAITIFFLSLAFACGPSAADLDATSTSVAGEILATQDAAATVDAGNTAVAQEKLDAEATTLAEVELANQRAEATLDAIATATAAQATQEMADQMGTATAKVEAAEAAVTAAAAVRLVATSQAEPMMAHLQKLQADGQISSTDGTYYPIDDFSQTWAQLNWYRWWFTGYAPDNFVIRTDVTWESGSDTADWWNSGCGFVFRLQDNDNFLVTFLTLDGYVSFTSIVNGNWNNLGRGYAGNLDIPRGEGEFTLVVEGDRLAFLLDGRRIYRLNYSAFDSGDLALTLASGTNKDFGTRCTFTNIDLWELE